MEIERKFLIKQVPEHLDRYPCTPMEQAYISTEPVIRIRRSGEQYWLTCKGPGLLKREEFELPLTEAEYGSLLLKTEGAPIVKDRYEIPLGEHLVQLDVFQPPLAPLVMAEVEFSSEEEAAAFCPPNWFGEEVTQDPCYTNAYLSRCLLRAAQASLIPGRYRHFKGGEYQLLCTATHSETQETMVVYRALYGEKGLWVRPAARWSEEVYRDGYQGPRFYPIDEEA